MIAASCPNNKEATVKTPMTGGLAKLKNNPGNYTTPINGHSTITYTTFCDFVGNKGLGATGIDVDYEEFWHVDTYRKKGIPNIDFDMDGVSGDAGLGPINIDETAMKFSDIINVFSDKIKKMNQNPILRLSTPGGATSCTKTPMWGGNLRSLFINRLIKKSNILNAFSGGINIMSYDLSADAGTECEVKDGSGSSIIVGPLPKKCDLPSQVNTYLASYNNNCEIKAGVGIEIGQPAYPALTNPKKDKIRLTTTKDDASQIIESAYKNFNGKDKTINQSGGAFFWDLFKEAKGDPPDEENCGGTGGTKSGPCINPVDLGNMMCKTSKETLSKTNCKVIEKDWRTPSN